MKKFILALILAICSIPAMASFTLVQATQSAVHPCSASSSCSMTVTSTGSGHLLVLVMQFSSTHNIKQTGMTGGGTWIHPGTDAAGACQNFESGDSLGIDCAYVLSSSSGATTISWSMDSTTFHDFATLYEFSFTGSSVSFDAANSSNVTSFQTNPVAPSLTISGSNDCFIQGLIASHNAMTTIDTGYSALFDNTDSFIGTAYKINAASYSAPTWGNGNNHYALNVIAFSEASPPSMVYRRKGGWRN